MNKTDANDMQAALEDLYRSTAEFHKRFNTPTDYEARIRVLVEECGELVRATTPDEITKEAADVLVTAFGVMFVIDHGLDIDDAIFWCEYVHEYRVFWYQLFKLQNSYALGIAANVSYALEYILGYAMQNTTVEAIRATIAKNESKTPETHYLSAHGKVTRR